ncbi:MAG: DNA translocase FtsK [Thermoguttaceae bacterium]|nr:DNA translocase FtsK [Thermoguttaceae bacterium]MDW8080059.1 DNA translocase FtsK [Thermoguttaceae bacterium]
MSSPSGQTPKTAARLAWDLLGLALGACCALVAVSLIGYHPGDPPRPEAYPLNSVPANPCGLVGAYVAWAALSLFGAGAFLIPVFLALAAFACFRRKMNRLPVRLLGVLVCLASFGTLMGVTRWPVWEGPVIGPAGWLGMAILVRAEKYLAPAGIGIVAVSGFLAGLLLATDYLFVRLAYFFVVAPLVGLVTRALEPALRPLGMWPRGKGARIKLPGMPAAQTLPKGAVPVRRPRSEPVDLSPPELESGAASGISSGTSVASKLPAPTEGISGGEIRIRKPRLDPRQQLRAEIEAEAREHTPHHYVLPPINLLLPGEPFCFEEHERDVRQKAAILEKTFADFGYHVRVVEIQTGPVIAQFEVELEAGLRVSKIMSLADDLAIALRVPSVRIVAPIPGKNTVAIEVPNAQRQIVRLREVMEEAAGVAHSMRIPVFLGKDVAGNPIVVDLTSLPHLLIAGRTGTGKSVCLNAIIMSILMSRRPDEVRMLLIDPKMVELSPYKRIPHLLHPVVTDMRKAEAILAWAVEKMEERYQLLARAGVRHLSVYNQLGEEELRQRLSPISDEEWAQTPRRLPYIVIVADEMADLMMTAAKEVETHIIRLAQKSRAVGIHLVLATQKPTVDVITGLIKSNLPARICFEVSSRVDSRVVLDEIGAEKLLGNGDMLFLRPGTNTLIRGQGTFVSDDEISRVVAAIATSQPDYLAELVELAPSSGSDGPVAGRIRDELYETAVEIVVREGRGSVSLLQRALGIGYGRAARLIDYMAEDGIVGPYNGSQAREVLISLEEWEARKSRGGAGKVSPGLSPRPNRPTITPETHTPEQLLPGPNVDERKETNDAASKGGPIVHLPQGQLPPEGKTALLPGKQPPPADGAKRENGTPGQPSPDGRGTSRGKTWPPIPPQDGAHWPRN